MILLRRLLPILGAGAGAAVGFLLLAKRPGRVASGTRSWTAGRS